MSRFQPIPPLALSLLILTGGCAGERPSLGAGSPAHDALDRVGEGERVLATVGGSRIGEGDLSVNLVRTLGDARGTFADAEVEHKVLESMIASRAIALEALAGMDEEARVALDKRVAQFREELLVKRYLIDHAEPHTLTAERIEDYYKEHPEEFAGAAERLYEIVTVAPAAYERDSREAIETLSRAKTHDDWRALATETAAERAGVSIEHGYRTLVGDEPLGPVDAAALALDEGAMSRLVLAGGAPYFVRLLEVRRHDPVPLEQARAGIKRKLLPQSVRASVRELSETVLARTEVVLPAVDAVE